MLSPQAVSNKESKLRVTDLLQVALAGVFTAAVDGHHLLISNTGETVRFTLAAGTQVCPESAGYLGLPLPQCFGTV